MTSWDLSLPLAAPFIGSFLGSISSRVPEGRTVWLGRSQCQICNHVLGPADLVPIISWAFLRGRCRYCGHWLGLFYPLIELAALAATLWALAVVPERTLPITCGFGWLLLALVVTDWRAYLLPDGLVASLFLMGIGWVAIVNPDDWMNHATGAVAGGASFSLCRWMYRMIRKQEGLGLGDVKLVAALGLWLTWRGLSSVVLLAALGAFATLLLRLNRQRPPSAKEYLPFGTYLSIGAWITWLHGPLTFGS